MSYSSNEGMWRLTWAISMGIHHGEFGPESCQNASYWRHLCDVKYVIENLQSFPIWRCHMMMQVVLTSGFIVQHTSSSTSLGETNEDQRIGTHCSPNFHWRAAEDWWPSHSSILHFFRFGIDVLGPIGFNKPQRMFKSRPGRASVIPVIVCATLDREIFCSYLPSEQGYHNQCTNKILQMPGFDHPTWLGTPGTTLPENQ